MNSSSPKLATQTTPNSHEAASGSEETLLNENYTNQFLSLLRDALGRDVDVAQLPNGDVMTTETETITVTHRYNWNEKKQKFERFTTGTRQKRKPK